VVFPSKPFFGSLIVTGSPQSVGPDTGTLGVSTLTFTNFDGQPQQVFIYQQRFASGSCGGDIINATNPTMIVYVQPARTW